MSNPRPNPVPGPTRPLLRRSCLIGLSLGLAAVVLWKMAREQPVAPAIPPKVAAIRVDEPIKPIPTEQHLDARQVALGNLLFHEKALSHDNTISCASCHDLPAGGADHHAHSLGIGGAEGTFNAPTVLNAVFNFRQFWDGRARTLEEQIDGPTLNHAEMGASWPEIVEKLRARPDYQRDFAQIYPDGIQPQNVRAAIAEFERSLTTPNARFDKFLRGDASALTAEEIQGYRKFKTLGCTSCHQGVNVGGNMFETFGTMADYFAVRGHISQADYGRFNLTGKEDDRYVFKVPSLRNVERTAPYLSDGSARTLREVVLVMGWYQLSQRLSPEEVDQIVLFLKTLTGEYEGRPL